MNNFFIYQYTESNSESVTVLFVNQSSMAELVSIEREIRSFFAKHILSHKLVVILPKYADKNLKQHFISNAMDIFRRVPGRTQQYLDSNYYILEFDEMGNLFPLKQSSDLSKLIPNIIQNGLCEIFVSRNGLVESSSDHHFVFPSGKHCSKFLRTGNILINSAEIFFIASQLLGFVNDKSIIYCDTSSINVLAFAIYELKRRFGSDFSFPAINSFESYNVFEQTSTPFGENSVLLISSSTSGNIIEKLVTKNLAKREQIKVLFFVGLESQFASHRDSILCNLSFDADNRKKGVQIFDTYSAGKPCKLCADFSRPISINSDVFLTIQPKVNTINFITTDAPRYLSEFIENYRGIKKENVVLKNFYKEDDSTNDYELFIETEKIFKLAEEGQLVEFNDKLNRLINLHIPANVKHIVHLPDNGSKLLATQIINKLNCKIAPDLSSIDEEKWKTFNNEEGAVVIVASSIVTGRHLLHLSRGLREKDKLGIIYFIGFKRCPNLTLDKPLISNLSKGKNKSHSKPVISVEEIFCSPVKSNTSWKLEKEFIEENLDSIEKEDPLYSFLKERRADLLDNKKNIGLVNNVFLKKYDSTPLFLRRGFAFWDFEFSEEEAFQSEVCFTMALIINHLENTNIQNERSLMQSNYVRNLISPEVFLRYNDGVIQAAILRVGKPEHFSYDIDADSNLKMKTILLSIVDQFHNEHGEAILEFLLAIALKKMRLKKDDTIEVLTAASKINNDVISGFSKLVLRHLEYITTVETVK